MTFVSGLYTWLGVAESPFDPQARFVTSYLLSPFLLFIWRATIAVYTLVTIIVVYCYGGSDEFAFFTVWSYWGVTSYFAVSAIYTFSYTRSYSKWKSSKLPKIEEGGDKDMIASGKPQSWLSSSIPRPLQFLHYLLWSTICTFPLVVTVIFWTILNDGPFASTYSAWSNLSIHAFNLAFTMIEIIFFSRGPMLAWSHCFFCICFLALYVALAFLFHYTQGFYSYDFLNVGEHGQGVTSGIIVAIGVAGVISFMIGQFLIFCREWVAAKIQGSGGWGSAKAKGVADDALFVTKRGPGPEGEGGRRSDSSSQEAQSQDRRQRW